MRPTADLILAQPLVRVEDVEGIVVRHEEEVVDRRGLALVRNLNLRLSVSAPMHVDGVEDELLQLIYVPVVLRFVQPGEHHSVLEHQLQLEFMVDLTHALDLVIDHTHAQLVLIVRGDALEVERAVHVAAGLADLAAAEGQVVILQWLVVKHHFLLLEGRRSFQKVLVRRQSKGREADQKNGDWSPADERHCCWLSAHGYIHNIIRNKHRVLIFIV